MAPIRLILYTSKHLNKSELSRQPGILGGQAVPSKQYSLDLPAQVNEKSQSFDLAACTGVWSSATFTVR